MKYLMVEDDFSDVALLKLLVKRLGYEVAVCSPLDAAEWNMQNSPEVVQLDGLDGMCFRLAGELRKANPDARYILFSVNCNMSDNFNNGFSF